jgi:catecholate siderophore receptor
MGRALSLRNNIAPTTLGAGVAATLGVFLPLESDAQEAEAIDLSTIEVDATRGGDQNALNAGTGLSRLPGRIQDTPQTINVVPREILEQQNVTTVEQALRNVPGVTLSVGEGNGGLNGDQFRIRGFQAKNDIYLDGLRDFGVYVRDSFNIENVQVIKGPSSETFGLGTTGGVINSTSKRSFLGNITAIDGTFGTGPLARTTVDVNRQIGDTTAIRLNGMFHDQDIVDRDNVESNRWGIAGSLGFGLGTDTTWFLNYFHQHTDRTPDYGVPTVRIPGTDRALPVTEFGVPRSTSYVRSTDRDVANVDLLTSLLTIKPTDWLTITNDTRLSFYDRAFSTTAAVCADTTPPAPACVPTFFRGRNPVVGYSAGGGPSYWQDAWGIQNVTTAVAKFNTGPLRHEVVTGLDVFYQNDERTNGQVLGTRPNQTLFNPIFANTTGYAIVPNPNNRREGEGTNVGVFASDRVWLTETFSILGGLRWDNFTSRYRNTVTTAGPTQGRFNPWQENETSFVSPKGSVIWEPTPDQTFYATYARSFSPPGQFIANSTNIEVPGSVKVEPEQNDLYEVGAKFSFLDQRLGFNASLFRIDKSNSADVDPVTGDIVYAPIDGGESRRVQGFELGLTGKVTDAWTVQLGYAHLDSEVLTSSTPTNVGNRVQGVAEHSAALWSTYDVTSLVGEMPGKLLVGGGITYDSGYYAASDNITWIPKTFSVDALISYEYKNFRIALNGYNLTDELNYGSSFSTRAVPAAGRTVTLTIGARF